MSNRKTRRQQPNQLPQPIPAGVQRVPAGQQPAAASSMVSPTPPSDEKQNLDALVADLEKARQSRVIVYWTSDIAKMSEGVVLTLYDQLTAIGKTDRLDLFLRTNGGDTEVPWRIVSLAREFAKEFNVLVPYKALSSGTLTALGADNIVMTPLGVLGPIDPSRTHPLLPRPEGASEAEPISVQDMRHAMQFIREAAGTDKEMPYTPEAMAQIFTALFDKIHPLAIGAIEQSYALAKLIARQCLGTHMDPDADGPKIDSLVDKLCDDYKSHSYQLSREEARRLGLKVQDASADVEKAMMELFRFYVARPVMPATPPAPGQQVQGTSRGLTQRACTCAPRASTRSMRTERRSRSATNGSRTSRSRLLSGARLHLSPRAGCAARASHAGR